MKLKDFLEVLAVSMPFTVATIEGEGWLLYYDGEHTIDIPGYLADRLILNIYPRSEREKVFTHGVLTCCDLKSGLAILVEGCENGSI